MNNGSAHACFHSSSGKWWGYYHSAESFLRRSSGRGICAATNMVKVFSYRRDARWAHFTGFIRRKTCSYSRTIIKSSAKLVEMGH